jgi:hypothetical protein
LTPEHGGGIHPVRRLGTEDPGELAATDALLDAVAAGEAPPPDDIAARLLAALAEDVGQWRSSVSMTPST